MHRSTHPLAVLFVSAMICAGLAAAGYSDTADTVGTAIIKLGDAQTPVLTDTKRMTLYYFMLDTTTRSACARDCARMWPPLLSTSAATTGEKLPGKLAVVPTSNGPQVAYNGHLLYTYSGDDAAGQANGQCIGGKWWAATIDLKPAFVSIPAPSGGEGRGESEGGKDGGGGMGGGY